MYDLLSVIIIGLSVGGMYALLALGLAMIFAILGLLNLAHGELIAVTAYAMFFLTLTGMPFVVIVMFAILMAVIGALLMERIAFRPIRNAGVATGLITSFGLEIILQSGWQNFISPTRLSIDIPMWLIRFWDIGDTGFSTYQGIAISLTILTVISLTLFLKKSTVGLAMRAAAENFPVTQLMGIRANAVIATAFGISGFLAGVSGFLWIVQRGSADPHMGLEPGIMAFISIIFGGTAGLVGPVLGGLCLGLLQVALRTYLPDSFLPFQLAISYLVVICVLVRWPDGLISIFKTEERERR
jgi:branched-chain amino acid transport system permease protein